MLDRLISRLKNMSGTARELRGDIITPSTPGRFTILDALRGILALVVVLGHTGMPPIFGSIDQVDRMWRSLARFWETFAFGPPAVIAFFVISGFCIHQPFANPGDRFPVVRFYLRRYLRIGIPILAVVVILHTLQTEVILFGKNSILWKSTLWSVICEEIYYALYPLLHLIYRRVGVGTVLLISMISAFTVVTFTFPAVDWSDVGIIGTSVILLPVWLLGATLAEWVRNSQSPTGRWAGFHISIGWWRAGAWGIMWLALVMHFHSGLHQTASGIVVGGFAFLWLQAELAKAAPPPALLIWFGTWSYSLYLVHPLVISFLNRNSIYSHASLVNWGLVMALTLGFSYLFFILVEAPSHALARLISLRVTRPLGLAAYKAAR